MVAQDRKHIQAVVEVAAKFALPYHLRQISVCCRHQPNVHLMSPIAAQTFELLFLQYAQELRLQCRRNIAHLVQEERAFVGQFETAYLLCDRPGERASLVAKQLTFQQI